MLTLSVKTYLAYNKKIVVTSEPKNIVYYTSEYIIYYHIEPVYMFIYQVGRFMRT